jgi:plastocyanin
MTARPAALLALLLLPGAALADDVTGQVRFTGPPPPAGATLPTNKDRETCGPSVPDESLLVSEGGVENVVVRVEVPGRRAAPRGLTLDQRRCRYLPRAQAAAPGSTLELRNGDPVLHNVHGYAGAATAFNVPMPLKDVGTRRALPRPGVIRVGCDVHAWMAASIVVTETPFVAVTGKGGRFTLPGLPAGSWQAVAWHERLGERRTVVQVPASGPATLDFSYP